MKKRLLVWVLAAGMCMSTMPVSVLAETLNNEEEPAAEAVDDVFPEEADESGSGENAAATEAEDISVLDSVPENEEGESDTDIELLADNPVAFEVYCEDDDAGDGGDDDGGTGSLIFYYDDLPAVGDVYDGRTVTYVYTGMDEDVYSGEEDVPWNGLAHNISEVIIDESFSVVQPVSTACWFSSIRYAALDIEYLDTSKVTTMYMMFNDCKNETEIDVSGFDTSSVTNMDYMFLDCRNVETLDVSGWDL